MSYDIHVIKHTEHKCVFIKLRCYPNGHIPVSFIFEDLKRMIQRAINQEGPNTKHPIHDYILENGLELDPCFWDIKHLGTFNTRDAAQDIRKFSFQQYRKNNFMILNYKHI